MKKGIDIALLALALALPAYAQTDCRARAGGGYTCYDYSSGSSTDDYAPRRGWVQHL